VRLRYGPGWRRSPRDRDAHAHHRVTPMLITA
jgi:hypothetical protein